MCVVIEKRSKLARRTAKYPAEKATTKTTFRRSCYVGGGDSMKQHPFNAASGNRYTVPVVKSAFRVLEELSRTGALGLNDVTQRTGIPKSTVFRILTTLMQLGYVIRDGTRTYQISRSIGDLAGESGGETLRRLALPYMLPLRDQHGETVNLGVLHLDKVIYLEVVPSEYALRLHERCGATVSAHASSLGKAILAFSRPALAENLIASRKLEKLTPNTITDKKEFLNELKRVRERGYALDRGETSSLATCIGAPILDSQGNAIAAISISGPSSRFNPRKDSSIIESLMHATEDLSRQLYPSAGNLAAQNQRSGGRNRTSRRLTASG